jgi:hypothetical protein
MKFLKNNALGLRNKKQLCKTRNGKNFSSQKIKLSMYKSYNYVKTYHPLKRKKIQLHKFKFVPDIIRRNLSEIATTRRRIGKDGFYKQDNWSSAEEIMNWLASVGIRIKRINSFQFLLINKVCSFNYIVLIANKKRLELGLTPFYIEGVTEY